MSQQPIHLNDKSAFDKGYQSFIQSRLSTRLREKYRDKPFFEKWLKISKQINAISYVLNTLSVFTGFTFLFFSLLFLMGISTTFQELQSSSQIYLAIISAILSTALLILAESLKRGVVRRVFQEWLQYRKLSFAALAVVVCSSISVFFSYQGANRFVHEIRTVPILIDVDSIHHHYTEEIAATEQAIKDNFKKNSWKGKLSRDARPTYNTLHAEKARLARERDKQVEATQFQNTNLLSNHANETTHVASAFAFIQIVIELTLLLCLFWMEYYDFRSAIEFSNYSKKQTQETTTSTVSPNSESLLEQGKQTQNPIYTIEHNGKHYTESQVNNFIRIYEKRANNSSSENTRLNNQETLDYWLMRKMEFGINEVV